MARIAEAFAPGSIGNVGPGLDVLGLALAGTGDTVTAERRDSRGIEVAESGHPDLPQDPERHASGLAARGVLARAGAHSMGLVLRVRKRLPLAGGQGGSAASAVAGAGAANALLDQPLPTDQLLAAALEAEATLAGRHLDNIAASLLGGLVLVRSLDPIEAVTLPVPPDLPLVLVQPKMTLRTADGRAALPASIPLATTIHQMAQVGAIVAACASGDLALLGRALDDRIAEPARSGLLPGFAAAKSAALEAGALGCSISGSGPTAFALAPDAAAAPAIARAMVLAYQRAGLEAEARITHPDVHGLRVELS
ncbi:MAG TPA: homoserine kinase [Gemmatimonadales bacterium]